MSGNFDSPPASNSTRPVDVNSIPARFHDIRQTLQRERERDRNSWDHAAAERSRNYRDMPPVTRSASHRRLSASRGAPPPFRNGRRVTHAAEPPSSLGRRPRAPAREAYPMSRARRGLSTREQYANLHPNLERPPSSTSDRLQYINSSLNELRDPNSLRQPSSFPNLEVYLPHGYSDAHDDDMSQQRSKRRKMEHHDTRKDTAKIEYGHFGQVVAGQLKMQIISCDGGQLRDQHPTLHSCEHVLRTDKSVYCTERSQCNLLLCHQGETVFSLEKLIIKGPEKGFTAPVQEGLVFVSMTSKALLSRASQFNIRYTRPSLRPPARPTSSTDHEPFYRHWHDAERSMTLLEAINDDETWETSRRQLGLSNSNSSGTQSSAHYHDENEEDWQRYSQHPHEQWATADHILSGRFDHPDHPPLQPEPSPRDFRAPTPPPPPQICVTTDADDTSIPELEEESTSPDVMADRAVREAHWRNSAFHEDFDSDTAGATAAAVYRNSAITTADGNEDDLLPPLERMWQDTRNDVYSRALPLPVSSSSGWARSSMPGGYMGSQHRRHRPSRFELDSWSKGAGPDSEAIEPQASFFIPEDKSAIAIKFDPPICGKYICVRMFSPCPNGNIDVQSIVAYGFAGQRYFPACAPV